MRLRSWLCVCAMWWACSAPPPMGPPAAPTDLAASQVGSAVHLTWKDNALNEDELQIWRQEGAAEMRNLVTLLTDATKYDDKSVMGGVAYMYRVRASNVMGASEYSNEVSLTVTGGAGGGTGGGSAGGSAGGGAASACTITAPDSGTVVAFDQTVTFSALGDAGVEWLTNLSTTPLGTGLSFTRTLPVPGVHTVTCDLDSVVVTSQSPWASITHPGEGETRPSANAVPFVGGGRDFWDGPLPDAGMVWTSSIDGVIGTGRTFSRLLSAGTNVVTLKVTNSDGGTHTKSITLNMTP